MFHAVRPGVLIATFVTLVACDGDRHELSLDVTAEVGEAARAAMPSGAVAIVVQTRFAFADEGGRVSLGEMPMAVYCSAEDVPERVTGPLDVSFGPCRDGDVELVVGIASLTEGDCEGLDGGWSWAEPTHDVVEVVERFDRQRCEQLATDVSVDLQ